MCVRVCVRACVRACVCVRRLASVKVSLWSILCVGMCGYC